MSKLTHNETLGIGDVSLEEYEYSHEHCGSEHCLYEANKINGLFFIMRTNAEGEDIVKIDGIEYKLKDVEYAISHALDHTETYHEQNKKEIKPYA